MSNWSISKKVWLLLSALLAQAIVIIFVFSIEMKKNAQESIDSVESQVQPIILVSQTMNQLQRARINLRDALLATEQGMPQERIDYYRRTYKDLAGQVNDAFTKLKPLVKQPHEQELLAKAERSWVELVGVVGKVEAATLAGDFAEASRLITSVCYTAAQGAVKPLDELNESKKQRFMEQLNGQVNVTGNLILGTILVAGTLFAITLFFANKITGQIRKAVNEAVEISHAVANGDLSRTAKSNASDETGVLINSLGQMTQALRGTIMQVKNGVETMYSAATKVTSVSTTLSNASDQQSASSTATASAVEELSASVASVSESAETVLNTARGGLEQTDTSRKQITTLVQEIGKVEESVNNISSSVGEFISATRQISELSEQVKEIAEQTNLLALNAAIEAARAGEQGRGFAVVADEVRKLAEKSSESANTISTTTATLNSLAGVVEEAVQTGLGSINSSRKQAGLAVQSMDDTHHKVTEAASGVETIARSMREQREATNQVAHNIETIASMISQNQNAIAENQKSSVELNKVANELNAAVQRFRV